MKLIPLKPSFLEELETKLGIETSFEYKTLKTHIDCDVLNMYYLLEISVMNADILINNAV